MNQGRAKLILVLRCTRVAHVAARCRVTPGAVYHWRSGRRKPLTEARALLSVNYGIDSESWDIERPLTRGADG